MDKFDLLADMVSEKSKQVNITGIKDVESIKQKHVGDSLIISQISILDELLKKGAKVMDVGTGAGFPGIALALRYPKSEFLLIDGTYKKIEAVKEFIDSLGLKNVKAEWARTEKLENDNQYKERFDIVTARSVAYLPKLLGMCKPFVKIGGCIVLYKSLDKKEIEDGMTAAASLSLKLIDEHTYDLGGDKRVILTFQN